MKILIADDSEVVRREVSLILSAEPGWHVCGEACNGDDAIEIVRGLNPDLVLVDMRMPGKNGLEVAALTRQEFHHVAVIIMSQYDPSTLLPRVGRP